jgi:ParB-like chromosome segregation protein Spo0J
MTIEWSLKKFKVKDLQEYAKNPRSLSRGQADQLKESISKFGLIDKPVCTQDGLIIGGHARKKILEKLGIKEVDCYVPNKELDEREIEELNIRLNKNGGEFDFDILANHFSPVDLVSWGFDPSDLDIKLEDESEEEAECCKECGRKLSKGKR